VKIAVFLPSLCGGGAERMMMNLAGGFAGRGLKVDLVLAKAEGAYLSQVRRQVRVVDLGARRMIYSLPGLVRYLRRERPEALLAALDHTNLTALWARRLAGVPTKAVVSVRNTLRMTTASTQSLKVKLMPFLISNFYPWADSVVAVSHGVAEDLAKLTGLPREKIRVIYNPAITPDLFAKAEEPVDHPWFAPGEPPVVLSVGRLTPQKDHPTLIRAFALVRREHPARLMILGEGEERPNLEALVRELGLQEDVALPGFMDNPYKYMKRAGVFVLSSRWEGLPGVLIEALALGTPLVSTDCPSGPAEILEGGKWGKLVSVADIESMAAKIKETLCGPPSVVPEKAWARFTLQAAVERYLELLLGKPMPDPAGGRPPTEQ